MFLLGFAMATQKQETCVEEQKVLLYEMRQTLEAMFHALPENCSALHGLMANIAILDEDIWNLMH